MMEIIIAQLKEHTGIRWKPDQELGTIFGDYLKIGGYAHERPYQEIVDTTVLPGLFGDYLQSYNLQAKFMNLVFFRDAVQNISITSRALRQQQGHALLLGMGGVGKRSIARFAAYLCSYSVYEISVSKGYDHAEFREDLKKVLKIGGVQGKPIVLLLNDFQIVNEVFMEDIHFLLNGWDIPNLYAPEELEPLLQDIQLQRKALAVPEIDSKAELYSLFLERVRDNLHIIYCSSPVGPSVRQRILSYPSIVDCCTVTYFQPWPKEALYEVASSFFSDRLETTVDISRQLLANICVTIHSSVSAFSEKFLKEQKRYNYVTPSSYLELLNLFVTLLSQQELKCATQKEKFSVGIKKLASTKTAVVDMQAQLSELKPYLEKTAMDTKNLMQQVLVDQQEVDRTKVQITKEEAEVAIQTEEIQKMKDEAERDLVEALPALDRAVRALNTLNKNDISELKTFQNPPAGVLLVMEAICVMKQVPTNWTTARSILSDPDFLNSLINYEKDNISPKLIQNLKKYLVSPQFDVAKIEKVSVAAKSLCQWVHSIVHYSEVYQVVAPKKAKLEKNTTELEQSLDKLNRKRSELQEVESKLHGLKEQYEEKKKECAKLETKITETKSRLERAEKLISGLAAELDQWSVKLRELEEVSSYLVGSMLFSTAALTYLGAFTASYRNELMAIWTKKCEEHQVLPPKSGIIESLSEPLQIHEWTSIGLPTDQVSIENAILVTRGARWPLMIDPQRQANRWIKNMESDKNLRVIQLSDPDFLKVLQNAVTMGFPVLLENIVETLPAVLEPILLKQIYTKAGQDVIFLGDCEIPYSKDFRFYMTTKLENPHYLPEVHIRACIINFAVTRQGLEDQLLGDVVRNESPELEMQKEKLVLDITADKRELKLMNDRILSYLSQSGEDILDDQELIDSLDKSEATSVAIKKRLQQAEETEKKIDEAREEYRPVAFRGSLLYFTIQTLSKIDPMYQYSLTFFRKIFNSCFPKPPKSSLLAQRLAMLIDTITETVYLKICQGLMEKHKLLFSFYLCTSIQRSESLLSQHDWNLFLKTMKPEGDTISKFPEEIDWIKQDSWEQVCALDENLHFRGIKQHILENQSQWQQFFLQDGEIPLQEKLTFFQQLILMRCFKPEKLVGKLTEYVKLSMGKRFIEPPPFHIERFFTESSPETPLILIITPGSDPTGLLLQFATKKGYADKLNKCSLGKGQGPKATKMIENAMKKGNWVLLQNCHLAKSWMPTLEKTVDSFSHPKVKNAIHPEFRLWLTSMPTEHFPVSVLQAGMKITNEPPKGLKANLYRSFLEMKELFSSTSYEWRRLLFGLCFFHAIIQERRKFGPLGWNIFYEFNNSDLQVSMQVLKMFLEEDKVSFQGLLYVTAEVNYGGRVTDLWDRRLLLCILQEIYNPRIFDKLYSICNSSTYRVPVERDKNPESSYLAYIEELPIMDSVEVFGLDENASVFYQSKESRTFLDHLRVIEPPVVLANSETNTLEQEKLLANIKAMMAAMPEELHINETEHSTVTNSLNIVLKQEVRRFCRLLALLDSSMKSLRKAIKGKIVMSKELEEMVYAILNDQVPGVWKKASYPSLMPLDDWVKDLKKRFKFFETWLEEGIPKVFWLPGFFFPQGLLTAVLQNYSRATSIPVDHLRFQHQVVEGEKHQIVKSENSGIYISGLHITGAQWNQQQRCIDDAKPGKLCSEMPLVYFQPVANYIPDKGTYRCPLYVTSARSGVVATSGISTNFICAIDLPSNSKDKWILRGCALICQPN